MSHPAPADEPTPAGAEHPSLLRWPAGDASRGQQLEAVAAPAIRELAAADFESPRGRRVFLPVFLFLATCVSTFLAGSLNWNPVVYFESPQAGRLIAANWTQGLVYMAAVVGILLTHEMGHFLQTVRYGVPASYPFFIPLPFVMTGTMGAVIGMEGSRPIASNCSTSASRDPGPVWSWRCRSSGSASWGPTCSTQAPNRCWAIRSSSKS